VVKKLECGRYFLGDTCSRGPQRNRKRNEGGTAGHALAALLVQCLEQDGASSFSNLGIAGKSWAVTLRRGARRGGDAHFFRTWCSPRGQHRGFNDCSRGHTS